MYTRLSPTIQDEPVSGLLVDREFYASGLLF